MVVNPKATGKFQVKHILTQTISSAKQCSLPFRKEHNLPETKWFSEQYAAFRLATIMLQITLTDTKSICTFLLT
ncbi:hypothetical protein AQUCO_08800002v1 [Aquilegia coerulea]|uniref:Uncharacterized protein n=1 Tax=Aquilegia coerulea TaxID=218851 RepID=A0A2G5C6D9_AQUCA|nr:hypothetical protein AQUCO_08800002v1 [Aquilegia coerulea]